MQDIQALRKRLDAAGSGAVAQGLVAAIVAAISSSAAALRQAGTLPPDHLAVIRACLSSPVQVCKRMWPSCTQTWLHAAALQYAISQPSGCDMLKRVHWMGFLSSFIGMDRTSVCASPF
jgi:hypothetical protein